jgi:putative thioredoxin
MTQQPRGGAGGFDSGRFNTSGAVDLAALAQAREAQAKARERAAATPAPAGAAASLVIDVTEASFEDQVITRSLTVPVVIDFWADWCEPCKQLSPILEKLAAEYDGRWVLAKVDVDAEPRLGQAFQVQSIPSLFAVVAGQPIPLFQGAVPEPQVRQVLEELLKVAAENGVSGRVEHGGPAPDEDKGADEALTEPIDPELDIVADALDRQDLDAAETAYRALLDRVPSHPDAHAGLANLALMRRSGGVDATTALAAANAAPDDVDAQLLAADALVLTARAPEGLDLLVAAVRRTTGDDRDRLRARLLELFDLLGADDPAVPSARLALSNALF